MKRITSGLICLCLVLAMTLSGCGMIDLGGYLDALGGFLQGELTVGFADMTYTRPDVDGILREAEECAEAARTQSDAKAVAERVWEFYWTYNDFYTNYYLANIHYSADLTDTYWEQEYQYCLEKSSEVDAALDLLHYDLADSPLRVQLEAEDLFGTGYFDAYDGESVWDAHFQDLMEQEAQLISRYYELSDEALDTEYYSEEYFSTYAEPMTELFVELIRVRQELARYAGYPDYTSFAYDFYYYRDYTPQQAAAYCEQIRQTFVPLYRQVNGTDLWQTQSEPVTERDIFAYVRDMASAMGGIVEEAFQQMEAGQLYDITYSENKYASSFELYLPTYYVPYVFLCPSLWTEDLLVFAHEFGHFCSDYASEGSEAGIDVAEIFSQGMEYLSLCYGDGGAALTELKMADGLTAYVEQAAYASFEEQVYRLEGDALTAEAVQKLYAQVCRDYGFDSWDWDSRDLICINHFYTYPMYVVSYVVSNDAALQLYQLEKQNSGAGLAVLNKSLDTREQTFLSYLDSVGLESPFAPGRLERVLETFRAVLEP